MVSVSYNNVAIFFIVWGLILYVINDLNSFCLGIGFRSVQLVQDLIDLRPVALARSHRLRAKTTG